MCKEPPCSGSRPSHSSECQVRSVTCSGRSGADPRPGLCRLMVILICVPLDLLEQHCRSQDRCIHLSLVTVSGPRPLEAGWWQDSPIGIKGAALLHFCGRNRDQAPLPGGAAAGVWAEDVQKERQALHSSWQLRSWDNSSPRTGSERMSSRAGVSTAKQESAFPSCLAELNRSSPSNSINTYHMPAKCQALSGIRQTCCFLSVTLVIHPL